MDPLGPWTGLKDLVEDACRREIVPAGEEVLGVANLSAHGQWFGFPLIFIGLLFNRYCVLLVTSRHVVISRLRRGTRPLDDVVCLDRPLSVAVSGQKVRLPDQASEYLGRGTIFLPAGGRLKRHAQSVIELAQSQP